MPGTFTAIPVGQGDAFVLERDDGTTILVDGGRARLGFSSQLSAVRPLSTIDVAVCTHADADHAEGLIGLLSCSAVRVREVWLPGRWTERLAQLCASPEAFLSELASNVRESSASDLEALADIEDKSRLAGKDEATSIESLSQAFEADGHRTTDLLDVFAAGLWPWFDGPLPTALQGRLWVEAIQTAARIREVARSAHHHGAKIRWFDFEEATRQGTAQGGEAFLQPLNAREITRTAPVRGLSALRFLALSVANRESLVFLAPGDAANSPVLFSADSDLALPGASASTPVDGSGIPLITAPHHGSEANRAAYLAVGSIVSGTPVWVRSDGNYSARPGASFLHLPQRQRVCTLCRRLAAPKQTVRLHDGSEGWQLGSDVRSCGCT